MSRPVRVRVMPRDQFRDFLNEAREKGIDMAEAADRAGLLLTPERKIEVERQALDQFADFLEATPVHQILPRAIGTNPADTYRGVIELIRRVAKTGGTD